MHAHVAGHALELARQLQQGFDILFLRLALGQERLFQQRIRCLIAALGTGWRQLQADARTRFIGNEFADAVAKGVAEIQHPPDVAHRRARSHGAECHDLADGVFAIFGFDVIDNAFAVALAKVDVKVGHGDPLGVQKTLEQQVVLQRVQVGDLQGIGHQRTRTRAAPRPDRAAVGLGPVDEVAHDQKVTGKAHLDDGGDLKLQPLFVAGALAFAHGGVRVELRQALLQTLVRGVAEIGLRRHALAVHQGRGELRELWLVQHQTQVAALGNLQGIADSRWNIFKQGKHLRRTFEVLLAGEPAHAAGVGEQLTVGDADPRLVRLKVLRRHELNRLSGHHRQLHADCEGDCCGHMGLVIGPSGALQLQIKAVGEDAGQLQSQHLRARAVALHQSLPHRPGLRAG